MGWAFFIQGDHSVPVLTGICSSHHLPPPQPPTVTSTTNHSLLSATTSAINTAVILTLGRGLHYQPWLLPSAIAPPSPVLDYTPNHGLCHQQSPPPTTAFNSHRFYHQTWPSLAALTVTIMHDLYISHGILPNCLFSSLPYSLAVDL